MFKDTDNFGIFGMRGAGKTHLCRTIQRYYPNVFIIDTALEYGDENNVFTNYNQFADFVIETENKNGFRAVFQVPISRDSNTEIVDSVCELLYARGNCTIVIEEIHNYASAHYCPPFFKHLALTGRHRNISYIFTTQRIAEVNKTMLTQCHYRFAGWVDNPVDEKALKEWGFNIDQLNQLNQREFLMRIDRDVYHIDNDLKFL